MLKFGKLTKLYMALCEGTIAVAFGLMAPMLVGAIGLAMDVSQAYVVRQRLHGAIDAAALSAAASSQDADEIAARVVEFINMNYPSDSIGILNEDQIDVDVTQSEVTVTASARFPTTFMSIFGYTNINVSSAVVVAREIKGLEVVLVLDNTGSLGTTNMASVKTAAKNFVQILFDRVAEPEDIKIGVVPYASSVRVGRYGLGNYQNAVLDENGNTVIAANSAGYGTPFVYLPADVAYTSTHDNVSGWYGCVLEHNATNYIAAEMVDYSTIATYVPNTRGQLWSTSPAPNLGKCMTAAECRGHGWDPAITTNDPYPGDTTDDFAGKWDIYSYGSKFIQNGVAGSNANTDYGSGAPNTCGSGYSCNNCYSSTSTPKNRRRTCQEAYCYCAKTSSVDANEGCPIASVLPLSSSETTINSVLNSMSHHGSTYSNTGMAWGMRVLSHDEPFVEGSEWGDEEWNKALVLMTDGEMSPSSTYSGYWNSNKTDDALSSTANPPNVDELNARLLEVCSWLKAEPRNVVIYTVTFDHATSDISESTKAIYRQCATDADHYFDAPSQANLITAFEQISGALANLHLKR